MTYELETDLKEKFIHDRPILTEWGEFVVQEISERLKEKCKDLDIRYDEVVKIIPSYRVKDLDSFIAKALYRNKNYNDCYKEITDKVGVRFVVLLSNQISLVKEVIEQNVNWEYSQDRNFEDERREHPDQFCYESVHYVLYSSNVCCGNSKIEIPDDTPCEVQIRTLLQHAYAEMSHDTVYKSSIRKDANIYRLLARSMALIESADHFFVNATEAIDEAGNLHKDILEIAYEYYPMELIENSKKEVNVTIVDDFIYNKLVDNTDKDKLQKLLEDKKEVYISFIQAKHTNSWIYRQPSVFIFYYLIETKKSQLREKHIFPEELLEMLFSDLGESYSSY